jgi:hypothetical protein
MLTIMYKTERSILQHDISYHKSHDFPPEKSEKLYEELPYISLTNSIRCYIGSVPSAPAPPPCNLLVVLLCLETRGTSFSATVSIISFTDLPMDGSQHLHSSRADILTVSGWNSSHKFTPDHLHMCMPAYAPSRGMSEF